MLRRLRKRDGSGRLDLSAQEWIVVLMIGLSTVLAAAFGWRAAQIGSTAAFDDRQSISETIKVEQRDIQIALEVADDNREYTRYLRSYALAAELDNQAESLASAGDEQAAADARAEAEQRRSEATERAADAGVFGSFSIAADLRQPGPEPRPFDFDEHLAAVAAEESTALDSAGQLDPQVWADDAESIRNRIEGLSVWTFVLLLAALLFTTAQVNSNRRPLFYGLVVLGAIAFFWGMIGGFSTDFFA